MRGDVTAGENRCRVEQYGTAGERQLARMLHHHGVRFEYEPPLAVRDRGYVRLWYPDFRLPDLDVYVEYDGLTNGDGEERRLHKQAVYEREGISCLWLSPEDLRGNWPTRVLQQIAELAGQRAMKAYRAAINLENRLRTRASRESGVYAWGGRRGV